MYIKFKEKQSQSNNILYSIKGKQSYKVFIRHSCYIWITIK